MGSIDEIGGRDEGKCLHPVITKFIVSRGFTLVSWYPTQLRLSFKLQIRVFLASPHNNFGLLRRDGLLRDGLSSHQKRTQTQTP